MIQAFANPARFMALSAWAMPLAGVAAALLFALGLPWGLLFSPADYQQGESVRIMYVHVPAAFWALGIYAFMAGASVVGLIWRHVLADVAARAAAQIGATFAAICLISGSIWGAPTWGTWWAWDVRLTSMLVLFIIYLGYLALWAAIEDEERAAKLAAILCVAGVINLPIVHFAVEWKGALHQPNGSKVHPSMVGPLVSMIGAYVALFAALLMANMRALIYRRRVLAARARRARSA